MSRAMILALGAFFLAATATARSRSLLQDSPASPPPSVPQKAADPPAQGPSPSPGDHKKAKKVWTNDNLSEVNGSAISQVGDAKVATPAKTSAAKPATSQEIATFRKQLTALQAQLALVEKQIAAFKSFNKGETPGSTGMQMHKTYSMEPIEDQVRKLEGKKATLEAQLDTLFDAARKRGIEPGQLP